MSVEDGAVTSLAAVLHPSSEGKSLIFKELQDSRKTRILSWPAADAQEALSDPGPSSDIPSAGARTVRKVGLARVVKWSFALSGQGAPW
jgi:hypothetical protein